MKFFNKIIQRFNRDTEGRLWEFDYKKDLKLFSNGCRHDLTIKRKENKGRLIIFKSCDKCKGRDLTVYKQPKKEEW